MQRFIVVSLTIIGMMLLAFTVVYADCKASPKEITVVDATNNISTSPIVFKDNTFNLNFSAYCEPVDIYFAILTPDNKLIFTDSNGKLTLDYAPYTAVSKSAVNTSFSVADSSLVSEIKGECILYWLVAAANGGDIVESIEGAYELGYYEIKDIVKKTININPLDPLFLTLSNSDGSTTEYYVSKKEDGSVDKVESINVISKENNLEFRVKIISDSKVELSTLTLEGALITKQIIDIKDIETSDLQAIKRSKKSKPVYDPKIIHNTTRALSNSNTKSANIEVTVNECGSPTDDANVFIILSGIDTPDRKLPARNNGNGKYLFEIPYSSNSDAPANAKQICQQGMDVINFACSGDIISTLAQNPITVCAYLTAIAVETVVGALYAPVLYNICLGSLVTGGLVCNTLGKSAVEEAPSVGDAFCQDGIDYIDWSLDSKYDHAVISASLPGQEMKFDSIKIVYGEQGRYSFDFESPEPIAKFTASPLKGTAPLVVSLDATGSTPSKEECVDYIWSSSASHNSNGKTTVMQFENSGEYTINLEVKSKDGSKSSISSATVVVDPVPPKIKITTPAEGAKVSGIVNIDVSITLYSETMQIAGVEFMLDGTIIGQDSEYPYTAAFNADELNPGEHTITAYAHVTNYSGGGVSDTITVNIDDCSNGKEWNEQSKTCECPDDSHWDGSSCMTCSNEKEWNEQSKTCECPDGKVWNGVECIEKWLTLLAGNSSKEWKVITFINNGNDVLNPGNGAFASISYIFRANKTYTKKMSGSVNNTTDGIFGFNKEKFYLNIDTNNYTFSLTNNSFIIQRDNTLIEMVYP